MRHPLRLPARLGSCLLLGVAALCAAPAAVGQDPWDDPLDQPAGDTLDDAARKLLGELRRPTSAEAFLHAARELRSRGGLAASEATRLLNELEGKRRKAAESAAGRINKLATALGPDDANAPLVERWAQARAHANEWLFDHVKFPPPKVQPVTGPVEGYDEAKARGDAAIQAHKTLRPMLDAAVGGVLRTSERAAAKLQETHAQALADWQQAYRALYGEAAQLQGVGDITPLAQCLLALANDDYATAAKLYQAMGDGWHKLCVFHAYGRKILARNAVEPCGMGKQAMRGLEVNNWYRMSLGIAPLWHNAKLAKAAQGHSDEMVALGYFGHDSPKPENGSPQKRAANEDYRAGCTECCSSVSTASSAMEMWKWDGGHHRAMIHWKWTEAGCSERGPCTLNPGSGERGSPPGIRY